MLKRIAILGLFVGALAIAAPRAEAAQITGSLSLSAVAVLNGDPVLPVNSAGALVPLASATALDFGSINHGVPTPGVNGLFQVDSTTGNFQVLNGLGGIIRDFSFTGAGSLNYPAPPINGFETIAGPGFAFDVLTTSINLQNSIFINLTGTGLFHLTGFDNTPGIFSFTVTQTGTTLSFAASEAAIPSVPEPGSMLLLGTGLAGLGASLRRRFARK